MSKYGLIGNPLSHSFSKKYFTKKFETEKLPSTYELFPLYSIDELAGLLKANPDLKGLNVTIPYKKTVLPFIQNCSNITNGINACNCIKITNGITYGFNTDITGFERSIWPYLKNFKGQALILGDGGAAQAVRYVFNKNQIRFRSVRRKGSDPSYLTYEDLDEKILSDHLLIVNTTPLGMFPETNSFPPIAYDAIGKQHYLFDMVYNPERTLFLHKGEQRGACIQNGQEMLIIQAEESWRIWNES